MKFSALTVIVGLLFAPPVLAQTARVEPTAIEPPGRIPVPVGSKSPHKYRYDSSLYIDGDWLWPDAQVVDSYFPARAKEDEVDGSATVDCLINKDGRVTACETIYENPKGYGFGEAMRTMAVAHLHVDPTSIPGGIKPGSRGEFTYKWVFKAP